MHIFLAVIIVILLITFTFGVNKKEFDKLKRNLQFAISLPGDSIFSSFINSLQIACNYEELVNYVDTLTKKHGDLCRLILGTNVFVLLSKPEDYKVNLLKNNNYNRKYIELNTQLVLANVNGNYKSSVTKTWKLLLGDGIIRTSGATHKLRRKILQPLLNLKYLSEYVTFFDTYSNHCADTLEKYVAGPIFDLKPYVAQYSFNIFLVTTVGIKKTIYNDRDDKILHWQEKLFKDAYNKIIKPWLRFEWLLPLTESRKQMYIAQKDMIDFIYSISTQKAENHTDLQNNNNNLQKTKPIFNNYWDRVQELHNNATSKLYEVSNENFLDDIRNFFAAIQNTITEVTSFIMLMLAMHTEVQDKLREEIFVTFNNNEVDAQRLLGMRYFYMVFQETLRLFPISPIISRQLIGDIKLESCTLPDECYVMIPIFAIHRNPTYWDKPLEFIPERFLPKSSSNRHRYTYIPFGTGPRDCLGQRYAFLSIATIIVNLLRRYRFTTTRSNINDIKITADIILRTQNVLLSISSVCTNSISDYK